VPLEGHWQRINTPVRTMGGRERRIVSIAAGLLALVAIAATIVAIGSSGPSTGSGCIRVDLPSTMGAVSPELCGSTAREFCISRAANSEPLEHTALPRCREAGLATGSA
jgi:hypothetical protein